MKLPPFKVFAKISILLIMLTALASGCATVPTHPSTAVYLKDLCDRYHVQWQWNPVSQTVTLRKGGSQAQGLIGSSVVVVDGQQVNLSAALRLSHSSILVPADFENKIIAVMEGRKASSIKGQWIIVIDAGHGGKDPGAIGRSGLQEKKVVLDIALHLSDSLERRGFKVVMTRDSDEFITLERRTEIASRSKADLFVSIHANSSKTSGARGIEVYTIRDLDFKEKREEQRLKNLQITFNSLAMDKTSSPAEKIVADMLYDYKRGESQQAASALSRGLSQGMDTHTRGTKEAGYFVLRNTLIPAVLVEVGFLSNSREEKQLASPAFRGQLADSLAENIANYASRRWE